MSKNEKRKECFVGLIAPIGVDLSAVIDALGQALKPISYKLNDIRLTDLLRENKNWYNIDATSEMDRYKKYITAGDRLCKDAERNDVFALYGIARLWKNKNRLDTVDVETMHVFRQLKRVEEIDALKKVYGRNIMFLACYASKDDRIGYLVRNMLKNERGKSHSKLQSQALDIIAKDEDERDNPCGQRVIECFPHADFVLDCTTHDSLMKSAERFVSIYFGAPFVAPSVDEYCSYIANAASYRSLDLSRQVGAALFGDKCELISLGCNEVPRSGGGTYWSDGEEDYRDYALGYDSNQRVREDMTRDALVRLQKNGWLSDAYRRLSPDELVLKAFSSDSSKGGALDQSMIADVIEFGRMVHAEMNALTDAARFRRSTHGATLYCTTLPCHMCTKLVIAAGIKRVVYIQPYGKSLIEELFSDSVAIDQKTDGSRVIFETLKGVTPNGFRMAFRKKQKRKQADGTAIKWNPAQASPNFLSVYPYYVQLEILSKGDLTNAVKRVVGKVAARAPKRRAASTPPRPGLPVRPSRKPSP